MASFPDKFVIELSSQDRRRIDRLTKAIESLAEGHKPRIVIHNHRSAETGEFVSEEEADENPSTTVRERR